MIGEKSVVWPCEPEPYASFRGERGSLTSLPSPEATHSFKGERIYRRISVNIFSDPVKCGVLDFASDDLPDKWTRDDWILKRVPGRAHDRKVPLWFLPFGLGFLNCGPFLGFYPGSQVIAWFDRSFLRVTAKCELFFLDFRSLNSQRPVTLYVVDCLWIYIVACR